MSLVMRLCAIIAFVIAAVLCFAIKNGQPLGPARCDLARARLCCCLVLAVACAVGC
jgi:hypothetical protein